MCVAAPAHTRTRMFLCVPFFFFFLEDWVRVQVVKESKIKMYSRPRR